MRQAVPVLFSMVCAFCVVPVVAHAAAFPAAEGSEYAVATDSADASHAAVEALRQGGNAADAAVAAALVLGVVSPAGSGLGGGGFALVYTKRTGRVVALDFREVAPAAVDTAYLASRTEPVAGTARATGLPGEPAGLEFLSKHYGRRALAQNAAEAVRLAEQGFYVSAHTRAAYTQWASRLQPGTELQLGLASGGSHITRPALGATLRAYAEGGARGLFRGEVGTALVHTMGAHGVRTSQEELLGYEVRQGEPLTWNALGRTWHSMPMPSAGGMMLREVTMAAGDDGPLASTAGSLGSAASTHLLAEVFRGALADRAHHAADPRHRALPVDLYAPARLLARWATIRPGVTTPLRALAPRENGTSHVVVVDAEGNVVSLTTTVNSPFGSGIEVPGTGLVLNDELYDFSSRAEEEAMGVLAPGPNAPRAGMRPVSSMAPTLAMREGAVEWVLGGSGGPRIATGVSQVALCVALHKREPGACVAAPRVHVAWDNTLLVDDDVVADVVDGLKGRGETVKPSSNGSAIQLISVSNLGGKRTLRAAADPRKRGLAIAH